MADVSYSVSRESVDTVIWIEDDDSSFIRLRPARGDDTADRVVNVDGQLMTIIGRYWAYEWPRLL